MQPLIRPLGVEPAALGGLDRFDLDAAYSWPDGVWVRANFAISSDGAIEVEGRSGTLGGPDDRKVFACLRAGADVVLVGSGTVRAEDYGVVRVDATGAAGRAERGQGPAVPVAVVTTRAELAPDAKLFRQSREAGVPVLVLTSSGAPDAARAALAEVAEVVVCGEDAIDDRAVLGELARRGLHRILFEGGPTLMGRLLRQGLLDELCLTISPVLVGPRRSGLLGTDPLDSVVRLQRTHLLGSDDGTLFGRYVVGAPQAQ